MTQDFINGGYFNFARKFFSSEIWLRPPLFLKIFLWIIGQANHKGHKKNGYQYKRGELVTTYEKIAQANSHYFNRKHIVPSLKQIRSILSWLEKKGMISVEPLKSGLGRTGAGTRAHTGAYIGIRIIVVNYNAYQNPESYKGRHRDGNIFEQGHYNNNGNNKNGNKQSAIKVLKHLNSLSGKRFQESDTSLTPIMARLSNFSEEDCIAVLETKWADPDFDKKYFQPSTLFCQTKFENYLNQRILLKPELPNNKKALTTKEIEEITTRDA